MSDEVKNNKKKSVEEELIVYIQILSRKRLQIMTPSKTKLKRMTIYSTRRILSIFVKTGLT